MPRLSILIPCLGGAAQFDATLVSVLQNRPSQAEVIVLHTEPYDDPYDLRDEVEFIHSPRQTTLAGLVNEGVQAATGEVVHVLACGLEVEEGWTTAALAQFADQDVAAVSPTIVATDRERTLAAGVGWSRGGSRKVCSARSFQILAPTLAAGFYRRSALAAVGGFEASLGDELADVGLGIVLRELGLKTVCEPKSRIVQTGDSLAISSTGPLTRARQAERLFWRSASGDGAALSLVAHGFSVLLDSLRQLPTAGVLLAPLGRLVGCLEIGAVRRYQSRLVDIVSQLTEEAPKETATLSLAAARSAASRPAKKVASTSRKAA